MNFDLQDLIKRHFWAVGAITVAACAFFGGKAASHYVEGRFLTDAAKAPKIDAITRAPVQSSAARSKSGAPLGDRNIFCSECLPPVPVAATTQPGDGSTVPSTSEPLQLIATSVHPKGGAWSMATILNTSTQAQGGYVEGAEIPGAGVIKTIQYKYVDFENAKNGKRLERIALLDEPRAVAAPVVAAVADNTPKDDMSASLDAGIKKIDDTNFEIDRSLVDKLLANPLAVSKGARVTPSIKNGKPNGIKLYAIRPSSIYAKLGLANGDTIHSINGFELDSLDKGLEVYQKVKDASGLQVSATRRGKPIVINYTVK